ncbi:MAG: hypothetical protein K2Y56_20710 [Methylobacterium sp.]|uniref:aldolase/citrate lyase family protein n=1 Tax=Methylobacterium sp. TaxID=409 RepID=UPI0025D5B872|nr:aldolase/citrate lyase family protein [Methylobacterium sp.]MBX9933910.1 hypothetical protein [Methylobacterium sp.]
MRAILIVGPDEPAIPGSEVYVRVADNGLPAALAPHAAGFAMSVPGGGRDVARLGCHLAVHEAEAGLPDGSTRILALVECAAAVLALPSLVRSSPRLCGIAWDAEALARDIGTRGGRDANGTLIPPLALVRSQVLLVAAAAGVEALVAAGSDEAPLADVEAAACDGFERR